MNRTLGRDSSFADDEWGTQIAKRNTASSFDWASGRGT